MYKAKFSEGRMFIKSTDMVTEVREKMRDGKGNAELLHIIKKEDTRGKVRLFAKVRLAKGCSIGMHAHEGEDEVFYILSGRGTAIDGGEEHEIGPGDAILTGNGASHSIENTGDADLEFMAVILLYA
jgi:mannose-6-phosphate isomerase-like protein (cupin superfamily)